MSLSKETSEVPEQAEVSHLLRLPAELRTLIFRHVLISEIIRPVHEAIAIEPKRCRFSLLFVNRQTYKEASYILYSEGQFVIEVSEKKISFLSPYQLSHAQLSDCGLLVPHTSLYNRICNMTIEITWTAEIALCLLCHGPDLLQNITKKVFHGLQWFGRLEKVIITWRARLKFEGGRDWQPPLFSRHYAREIVRPFEKNLREGVKTVVEVQDSGELVRGQAQNELPNRRTLAEFIEEMEEAIVRET